MRRQVGAGAEAVPLRIAAVMRAVEDLPFVPTTCTVAKRSCGESSAVISRRIRSSPKRMPKSSSERR